MSALLELSVNSGIYGEDGAAEDARINGRRQESILWATILELRCSKCDMQERWRGRSAKAVAKVARMKGWRFRNGDAHCPQHAPRLDRKCIPGICTYRTCRKPIFVAPKAPGEHGRPTNKCERHYLMCQKWTRNQQAKRGAVV